MPVTPFHFGPGILLKAAAPRHVSLSAFVASQFVIDLETAYHLLRGEWPAHRALHTFALAIPAGIAVGLVVWCVGRHAGRYAPTWRAELAAVPAMIGGLLGGATHPILDGVMHDDIRPLWPWSGSNPFHQALGLGALHLACVAAAIAGVALWVARSRQR